MSGRGGGFAGMTNGSFFALPGWVDPAKPPGTTAQTPPPWSKWAREVATGQFILFSPNFVWLTVAVLVYFLFPYDFEAKGRIYRTFAFGWVAKRVLVSFFVVFSYFGFWHLSLYNFRWSQRKFKPDSWPNKQFSRMVHNIWYTSLGALQWAAWECVFMNIYANRKFPYISDSEAFASPTNIALMLFWTAFVPLWRGLHFYLAHRFIHIKFLYRFVHSLHHRNTDIEPFAGLCMHPIEHLYYFSCIAPSLYFYMSPFHFLWNGIHLLISPAASHSGWEDHFQSDQFHYLHHVNFECNYGSASFNLDYLFGTFREQLGESKLYKGAGGNAADGGSKPAGGSAFLPKAIPGFGTYMVFTAAVFALAAAALAGFTPMLDARFVAGALAFGPMIFGALLLRLTAPSAPKEAKQFYFWPFHKEDVLGRFGLHFVVAFVAAVLPVYHTMTAALGTPAYCQLWGCPEAAAAAASGAW